MIAAVYQGALDQYMKRPLPWILVNGTVALAGTLIPLLGGLALMPALLRETSAALAEDRDPRLEALLDTSTLAEDLASMGLYVTAQLLGTLMCLIGWPVAWVLLWMTPEIRATRMVGPVAGMRLSAAFVVANLGTVLGIMLIDALLLSLGLSVAYIGLYVTMPLITLSWARYLQMSRPQLEQLADTSGLLAAQPPELSGRFLGTVSSMSAQEDAK